MTVTDIRTGENAKSSAVPLSVFFIFLNLFSAGNRRAACQLRWQSTGFGAVPNKQILRIGPKEKSGENRICYTNALLANFIPNAG